ncbi:MAG: PAS domain S-box protein [Steroidobacteraceae bacterium]|jgi:PAS domain S-box-containing protein
MFEVERTWSADGFMPHGMCYLWRPGILALHVASDALITLAYFSIPFTLLYFVRKRTDLRFGGILVCFAAFIISCGTSHLMEIWTIWYPAYWLSGGVKAVTALASVPTAILLVRLVPAALRMPSPSALEEANAELARELAERRAAEAQVRRLNESLEAHITARTAELSAANRSLLSEVRVRKQSDELLTLTLASIKDGVIVTDSGGCITFINDAATRLIGCEAGDTIQAPVTSVLKVLHGATLATHDLPEGSAPGGATPSPGDLLLIDARGREIPIDLRAAPLQTEQAGVGGWVYTLRDCTELELAEEVQQRMTALVESADDAIIMKDLDGVIRSWNAGAERLLKYGAAEIIGQPITQLLPDDRKDEESLILTQIRNGQPVAHFETVRRRKDGTLVDVSLTISPIRDRVGAIVGASKIMRDITERKQYVEQLRSLNAELQERILARNSELRERDALLQEIHHRVKNNLQVISSLINMQVRTLSDSSTRAALQQCRSRVETMAQIHEMLYQSKDYSNVPFCKYAKELTTRVLSASGLSPDEVTVHYEMQDISLGVDKAIPCALILNELISNALKHAFPKGAGAIRIELRQLPEARILLCVSDDGVGVATGFDPARSSSLGMQLVVTLAEQLDGRLEIDAPPGAAFRITFPSGDSNGHPSTA